MSQQKLVEETGSIEYSQMKKCCNFWAGTLIQFASYDTNEVVVPVNGKYCKGMFKHLLWPQLERRHTDVYYLQ